MRDQVIGDEQVAISLTGTYGNAIQDGNIVLCRIALLDGKVEAAKVSLKEAGKTPGSPQLGSFGPNMSPAATVPACTASPVL
jgi:hypothetical protein